MKLIVAIRHQVETFCTKCTSLVQENMEITGIKLFTLAYNVIFIVLNFTKFLLPLQQLCKKHTARKSDKVLVADIRAQIGRRTDMISAYRITFHFVKTNKSERHYVSQ
jgi:hypothetical protein